ncbi:hypothetical protein L0Z72_07785 [candidate division KSB1 bacterium]|nr:hypothetical protein [candidate division KSB1 bacterium]
MITYSRAEIIPSSKTAKNLGQILENLKKGIIERAIVSRNNELEAVILPIKRYEEIMEMAEILEHIEIAQLIQERKKEEATISFDEVLEKSGIHRNEI